MPTRRLNLKNMYNARDLGGYPAGDGKVTRFGVFVRSEAPFELPEEDIRYLLSYGISATADFRSTMEAKKKESSLAAVLPYYLRPVYDDSTPPDFSKMAHFPPRLIDQYTDIAETGKDWARDMMELAASEPGGLLFHCSAGKDRTGIMSCYLLSAAGVSREDIIADYCISEVLLAPVKSRIFPGKPADAEFSVPGIPPEKMDDFALALSKGDPGEFETSPASVMQTLLDYLDERYGGVLQYLRDAGVKEETILRIREKFLEDA